MDRFIADRIESSKAFIETKEEIAHITKILRMQSGARIEVTDGKGHLYLGEIEQIQPKEIRINIVQTLNAESEARTRITLYQGIPKAQKMDWIVQKTTEIGVCRIVPVRFERCVRIIKEKEAKENTRWQKIAQEAVKQSKRVRVPTIEYSLDVKDLQSEIQQQDLTLVCFENEEAATIKEVLRLNPSGEKVGIIIGPEGGLTPQEHQELVSWGAKSVSLGKRILRTETAAIVAAALIAYELE